MLSDTEILCVDDKGILFFRLSSFAQSITPDGVKKSVLLLGLKCNGSQLKNCESFCRQGCS